MDMQDNAPTTGTAVGGDTLNMIANQIMEKLPSDKDRQAVEKILDGALRILYGTDKARKQTEEFISTAKGYEDIVAGVILTLHTLYKKSKNTMPWGPAIAAGQILVLEGLAEAQAKGVLKLTDQVIADATKLFIEKLLGTLGVSTEQLVDIAKKAGTLKKSGVL